MPCSVGLPVAPSAPLFRSLLLEKKVGALADALEKKEAQLEEVLAAANLDPATLQQLNSVSQAVLDL